MDVDKYINNLPLMDSHFKVPVIGIFYLCFVLKIGPDLMRNKQPLNLRNLIPIYNLIQVFANSYLIYDSLQSNLFEKYIFNNMCDGLADKTLLESKFLYMAYLWCLLKISDLMDTVFFILTKKFTHVSFLHVYHHITTMILAFCVLKYIRAEQAAIYAFVNCIVHVVMYTYYFLSSLGIKVWWKKLVTLIQLTQFVGNGCLTLYLLNCQTKNLYYFWFSSFCIFQCLMYIALFGRFYIKSYKKDV